MIAWLASIRLYALCVRLIVVWCAVQVLAVQQLFNKRVSNIVFMGMGEPLLNLPAVTRAHRCLNQVGDFSL